MVTIVMVKMQFLHKQSIQTPSQAYFRKDITVTFTYNIKVHLNNK